MWSSGAVLVLGIAIFLGVFFSRGTTPPTQSLSTISSKPSDTTQNTAGATKVPASASALQVAHTFLETAVVRKNLDTAYALVGPFLKTGISRKAWRTGNIPVQPYPAMNVKSALLQVLSSTKSELILQTVLNPRVGSGVKKPQVFDITLNRIGGKWLVNNFQPVYKLPIQVNPYGN